MKATTETRIEALETAVLGLLRGPYMGSSQMAVTFACLILDHPLKPESPAREGNECFCTVRRV